jgi:3-hydroxy-9,10-secoandrosta-1,3,5(10)-triene-9,17-dione monooxygenase reductase component
MSVDATRALRDALGRFATGIAVLTTVGPGGEPVGLTINSFNSVSLQPPLVLFSLGRRLRHLTAFQRARAFGLTILRVDQEHVSRAFAAPDSNPFAAVTTIPGTSSVPLIVPALAHFELRPYAEHDGGDHRLFVAEVVRHEWFDGEPLLYFAGQYRQLLPKA